MGGHAFERLHCPRISREVYAQVKLQTTVALRTIFSHVVVPVEMPEKLDFGDIDFLVAGPLHSLRTEAMIDNFDWSNAVRAIKASLLTTHGYRGRKNPDCMYFAIRAPGQDANDEQEDRGERKVWIQVDVKVCFKPELFEWYTFELNYASNSKMIGSMVKPLGLTLDPEGLHIRVEEFDETNRAGSMVSVSKDPRDVLRIVGLDRRIVEGGFKTKEEIYAYFTSSWLFNPAHFAARLAEEPYAGRLEGRSPHWTQFIKEWIPQHYPGYKFIKNISGATNDKSLSTLYDCDIQAWYKRTRAAVREKVFTMFPLVALEYYTKRAVYVKEVEEQRLRIFITKAIPTGMDGWGDDFPKPKIIIKQPVLKASTPQLKPTTKGELTPPLTPTNKVFDFDTIPSTSTSPSSTLSTPTEPWNIPLYLEPLTRTPPFECTPRPPPSKMSTEARLLCVYRWTDFSPMTGAPYLLSAPRKDFDMQWANATYAGATEEDLVKWAQNMWWTIWVRQCHVSYVGMWKKRFEKEDKKIETLREEEEEKIEKMRVDEELKTKAEEKVKADRVKIAERLKRVNVSLGLVEATGTEAGA